MKKYFFTIFVLVSVIFPFSVFASNWTDSGNDSIQVIGNVGVGTSSPQTILSLPSSGVQSWEVSSGVQDVGISRLTAGILAFGNGTAGDYSATVYAGKFYSTVQLLGASFLAGHDWNVSMGGSSGDGILIGSLNPLAWGSTSNAQFAIADVGFSRGGSNKIYLGNGTVGDYGGILIAGKLGLGSTSPTVPLTVAGSALFSGSTPTTPVDGELIYDSSVHSYKYWNSDLSAWLYLLGSTSASTIYTGSVTPAIGYYDFLLPFLIIIFLLVLLVGGKFISRLFPSVRLGFLS